MTKAGLAFALLALPLYPATAEISAGGDEDASDL